MKPDYKNWIPKGMMFSLIAGTALSLALLLVFGVFGIEQKRWGAAMTAAIFA